MVIVDVTFENYMENRTFRGGRKRSVVVVGRLWHVALEVFVRCRMPDDARGQLDGDAIEAEECPLVFRRFPASSGHFPANFVSAFGGCT